MGEGKSREKKAGKGIYLSVCLNVSYSSSRLMEVSSPGGDFLRTTFIERDGRSGLAGQGDGRQSNRGRICKTDFSVQANNFMVGNQFELLPKMVGGSRKMNILLFVSSQSATKTGC